ncbi:DUF1706 domain-containing protein [Campylobacter blaseri]|uniref:ClbS/DfsB family four-helix bundle protein n=1 Tax=Campylobacter blaseri TaxID=2042961 RepID=A0A2P8R3E6_9BACT|nr:ClbS/DfsB family four-helix bundle protein [Campylobacter blaseri]PSM53016.1 hypothetical protein CQ405_00210 [Campylobacter blaseri]PSM54483.1 hypothetical protein CRN67_00210 [Campylobacter blaseri]QKF85272.1 DUF1706 domain-containing protein [Campylobacter blaseri]
MPRAKTKDDLIKDSKANFEKLWKFIDSMSEKELKNEFNFLDDKKKKEAHWKRDKNLRDILVHLYEWHRLTILWIYSNQQGVQTEFLPKPYTWKTYGVMNEEFFKKHQKTSLNEAKDMLKKSHEEIMEIISKFSNEELFSKNVFVWTKTTTLGSYLISSSSSHYEWALKKLKAHRKKVEKL